MLTIIGKNILARSKKMVGIWMAVIVVLIGSLTVATPAQATTSTSGYAWGEYIGWVNFGTPEGHVTVTATNATGFAWSQTFGWINFGPFTNASGVANNQFGTLSGYAWSDQLGWINMAGVHISTTGNFSGVANATHAGRLNFSCAHCSVATSWHGTAAPTPGAHAATPVSVAAPTSPGIGTAATPARAAGSADPAPPGTTANASLTPAGASVPADTLFDIAVQPLSNSFGGWWWIGPLIFAAIIGGFILLVWLLHRRRRRQQEDMPATLTGQPRIGTL